MVLLGFRLRVSWLAQRFMSLVPFPTPLGCSCTNDVAHVIPAHHSKQEHIQGQGGGTDITVPENESAEQTGVGAVRGIVEIAVAVHEEQKHVSVSQVGAGRNLLSAEFAVPVSER